MSGPYDQVIPAETYSLNLTKSVIWPIVKLPRQTAEWELFCGLPPILVRWLSMLTDGYRPSLNFNWCGHPGFWSVA